VCTTGAEDGRTIAAVNRMGAASSCETRLLADTERLAESEQTCRIGDRIQTTHSTMRFVDDRTFTVDTVTKFAGLADTTTHSTVVYEGPCSAESRTAGQPSAEDCAELRASLSDSAEAEAMCTQVPANMQAQCQARLAAGRQIARAAAARCR